MNNILDTDLYKHTMGFGVLTRYPNATASYQFIDRGRAVWTQEALKLLLGAVNSLKGLRLAKDQRGWCVANIVGIPPCYWDWFTTFRFKPEWVHFRLSSEGHLLGEICDPDGEEVPWHEAIHYEVPLLALVSAVYYQHIDNNADYAAFKDRVDVKLKRLDNIGVSWAEMGTRRRRSFAAQSMVVERATPLRGFKGTSNIALARQFNCEPVGTLAHEWIMAHAAMHGVRNANREAAAAWLAVYQGAYATMLTDTYGTDSFLADCNADSPLAAFTAWRQDSGDPIEWYLKVMSQRALADNTDKRQRYTQRQRCVSDLWFTDGLDVEAIGHIESTVRQHERTTDYRYPSNLYFGIGTNLSNDFGPDSPALSIVMKLRSLNGRQVCKLSDEPGKVSGDEMAIRMAQYECRGNIL